MKRVRVAVATLDLGNASGRLVTFIMVSAVALAAAGLSAGAILRGGANDHVVSSSIAR